MNPSISPSIIDLRSPGSVNDPSIVIYDSNTQMLINIILNPEVLLSIVVLSLVLYGINLSTLKILIGILIISVMISLNGVDTNDMI